MEEIPSVCPTEQEFQNPIEFLSQPKVQRLGYKYGMIKLKPPASWNPPLSINKETFKFQVRVQKLAELNLINRSRMFFMKQLNNYHKSRKNGVVLKNPYVSIVSTIDNEDKLLYLYDIFIDVIKYFNKGSSDHRDSPIKLAYQKRINNHDTNGNSYQVEMPIPRLNDVLDEKKMWKYIAKKSSVSPSQILLLFKNHLAKYFQFLNFHTSDKKYRNLSHILYKDNDPKCLLSDEEVSTNEKSDGEEDSFSFKSNSESESEETIIDSDTACTICQKFNSLPILSCSNCYNIFHVICIDPSQKVSQYDDNWICNNCIIGNGYYGFKEEDRMYTVDEFKEECQSDQNEFPRVKDLEVPDSVLIEKLEGQFWGCVNDMKNTMTVKYGADIHNTGIGEESGFPTEVYLPKGIKNEDDMTEYSKYLHHPMNLLNLPKAEGSLLPIFGRIISGMTIPWIYVGSKFSTFCWHLEDQYTMSANYHHEGSPKVWYSVPEYSCDSLRSLLVKISPDMFEKQPDLMHQLVTLVSPYNKQFKEARISCFKAVQYPNEYIVTFPKCYHAGFNTGYNFNEAVNFTFDSWLPYGIEAVHDYRLTNKQCVFDMFELMLRILVDYQKDDTKFGESLARQCYYGLLEAVNRDKKLIKVLDPIIEREIRLKRKIDDAAQKKKYQSSRMSRISSRKSKNNEDTGDVEIDIFCSSCKTICSMTCVLHCKRQTRKRFKIDADSINDWNMLVRNGDFDILCLDDYNKLMSMNEETDNDTRMKISNNDQIVYIRNLDEITNIIKKAGKKIDHIS